MDRYEIATGKKPYPIPVKRPGTDAVIRAQEMMSKPMNKLHPGAVAYAKYLCNRYGGCGEVILTAYAHYAQEIEEMTTTDKAYASNEEAKEFFIKWCADDRTCGISASLA